VYLQYLLGFQRLGWQVLFLDQLHSDSCVDEHGVACPFDRSYQRSYLLKVMERFGLGNSFALLDERGESLLGLSRSAVLERVGGAAFLMNLMGYIRDEQILERARRRVFLDIDPGFGQMWKDLQLADVFGGHDVFVTIGENIGLPDCSIPTCGLPWITTPQPVVLSHWLSCSPLKDGPLTTVASWRGAYGPVEYQACTYGSRVHEFRKFVSLPRLTNHTFHLALDIDPAETRDLALLADNGWSLLNPRQAAGDPWSYLAFIQSSWAEFMVAKNMYVQTNSGWLSDRSLCYLASGRPVLAQDTGFARRYPTGAGLLTFSTVHQAADGVEELRRNYPRHARAARVLAEDHFCSDKVLTRLLSKLV
jgi:hypothetical protein